MLLAMCKWSQSLCLSGFSPQLLTISHRSLTICYIYNITYIILDKKLMELCRDINLPFFHTSRYQKRGFFSLTFYFPYPHGRICISYSLTTQSYKFKHVTFMNPSIYAVKERSQSNQDRSEGEIKKYKMRRMIVLSMHHIKHWPGAVLRAMAEPGPHNINVQAAGLSLPKFLSHFPENV